MERTKANLCEFSAIFGLIYHGTDVLNLGSVRHELVVLAIKGLTQTEMPEVNHRVGQRSECIEQIADALEANEGATEFILPSEHPFDSIEPFFENSRNE